ncbi:MAG: hypothetical protein M3R46_13555 [Actinomycetota bacterium]|nr:hypothetical protein [Actinomycetota bacterium]
MTVMKTVVRVGSSRMPFTPMYAEARRPSWNQISGAPPPAGTRQMVACMESVT